MTCIIGDRIIYLINMSSVLLNNYYMSCNDGTEVVEDETCPYFHFDILALFGMKIYCTDGMF